MRINKQDTQGTKPLLGKGELGYDDYTAGGDTGRVYVGTGTENIALAERLESNMMTKAQFNALAEERKANRGGSGFDEWGKHAIPSSTTSLINEGMWVTNVDSNIIVIGRYRGYGNQGVSKSYSPIVNINGCSHKIDSNLGQTVIALPTAPNIYPYDTVLTTEQINSGVIKHADASNSGLIVNGKFDTDTNGWTAMWNCTLSQSSGKLTATSVVASGYMDYNQAFATIIGKKYIVKCNMDKGTSSDIQAYIRTGVGYGTLILNTSNSRFEFTATTTMSNIAFRSYVTAIGQQSSIDNIAVYPADAISRSDLVFLESFHEDISEKNFVYPLGNTQYLGGNTDGLTGIANGAFTGFETYSLFGNFQTPSALIGKGYVWSNLTEAQKRAFIANPENNCYLDGDKVIQVRYRVRVMLGEDSNSMSKATVQGKATVPSTVLFTAPTTTVDAGLYSNTSTTYTYNGTTIGAISISTVSRRNQGLYNPVYNLNGSKKASDDKVWYDTSVSFTSISDCFDPAKLLTASGYIGSVSGRPDGLFYDQVHESDILDLRNSSRKAEDYNRLMTREFNKLVAGTYRGKEGEWQILTSYNKTLSYGAFSQSNTSLEYLIAMSDLPTQSLQNFITGIYNNDMVVILQVLTGADTGKMIVSKTTKKYDNTYLMLDKIVRYTDGTIPSVLTGQTVNIYVSSKSTRTKSNTLLHCDIIGNPANYPTSWKESGVFGTPLIVAEDGTGLLPDGARDTFKLSRKANATPLLCLRSTDSGATWTSFTPTFSTTINSITLTDEPTNNLVMVYYQTKTNMAVPTINGEVLGIGDVHCFQIANNMLMNELLSKVNTQSTTLSTFGSSTYTFTKKPHVDGYSNKILSSGYYGYSPEHTVLTPYYSSNPTVKVFPYLTRTNGKAYLNLVFKEMKHNGTSWGDDNKFNIVDNVSTTTDNNAQTVLIGQKTLELPYFIGADE